MLVAWLALVVGAGRPGDDLPVLLLQQRGGQLVSLQAKGYINAMKQYG